MRLGGEWRMSYGYIGGHLHYLSFLCSGKGALHCSAWHRLCQCGPTCPSPQIPRQWMLLGWVLIQVNIEGTTTDFAYAAKAASYQCMHRTQIYVWAQWRLKLKAAAAAKSSVKFSQQLEFSCTFTGVFSPPTQLPYLFFYLSKIHTSPSVEFYPMWSVQIWVRVEMYPPLLNYPKAPGLYLVKGYPNFCISAKPNRRCIRGWRRYSHMHAQGNHVTCCSISNEMAVYQC